MFAKTLIAALVLAGASLTLIANASAAPTRSGHSGWQVGGESYMLDRHDPTNTNSN